MWGQRERHAADAGERGRFPPQRARRRRLDAEASGGGAGDVVTVAYSATLSKATFWQLGESGENISMVVFFPTSEDGQENGVSVSTATLPSGKVITTWKLNQFSLANDGSYDVVSTAADSFDLFQQTSELAVNLAAEHSDGVLILDVIGNGGGLVTLGQWCVCDRCNRCNRCNQCNQWCVHPLAHA